VRTAVVLVILYCYELSLFLSDEHKLKVHDNNVL
jgi:hypothetical protein